MATIGGPKVLAGGMVFSVDSLNGTLTGTYEDTWADVSGHGNNLTLAATTSYGDAGFWPQFTREGAEFTRANINYAYNTSHNMADLSSCTVILWLKYTSTDNTHRIPIYVVDASGKFVFIELGSSLNYFGAATETQAINQEANSNPGTNDGKWHQLAVVRNGTSTALKLYFDGALLASTQDNVYGGWTAGASDISVGCGFQNGSAYDASAIDGYIRNVTVYNQILSLEQIKLNFNRRGVHPSRGKVIAVDIQAGGSGYSNGNLTASGGGGSGFAGTYTVSGGVINSVTLTNGGSGYTSAPTIVMSAAGSSGVVKPTMDLSPSQYTRFWTGFKYNQIINYAYTACGYKSSSPWKSVHKTVSSTDQTTNLGDLMQYGGSYISGACSKKILWLWGASNSFPGDTQQAVATNMFTDSSYSLTSAMNLVQSRNDAATVFKEHDFSWTSGGGSSTVDKFNFHTETMRTSTFTGGSPGEGGYGANGGFSDQHYGYWGYSGGTQKITFASDTFASHTSFWVNGQQKGMSSKDRKGMTGQQGSYSGGYHFNRWYFPTDTNLGAVAKPQPNCGEENFTMGQDHQYMLGNYDGVQNNENWKWYYATDTGTANVTGLSPTAHAGQSSGQCGWRE
jgi:hypothetical protein